MNTPSLFDDERADVIVLDATLSVASGVRHAFREGVPSRIVGGGYELLDRVELPADDLVRFASNGVSGYFCIQAPSYRVVEVTDTASMNVISVNASLRHFRASVAAFNARFPFYSLRDSDERWTQVAYELEVALASIDPVSQDFNGFWEDMLSSVTIGDYATEMITDGLPDPRD